MDEFSTAIGRIALWFSRLEDEISTALVELLGTDEDRARIFLAEMSFRNKVQAMASLVRIQMTAGRHFNVGRYDPEKALQELVTRCLEAEDLRNRIMHSSWEGPFLSNQPVVRRKYTAKVRGLRLQSETIDSAYLLDVADFIAYLQLALPEFFFRVESEEKPPTLETGV